MKQIKEQLHKDKIPFHQNLINLYFRKAFEHYQDYMKRKATKDINHTYSINPFEYWLKQLKIRLKNFSKFDQYYWDVLYNLNMRNKSLPAILQDVETVDPDKEAWIKQQINNPEGVFSKEKKLYSLPSK